MSEQEEYGLRFLAAHLEKSGRFEDLSALLQDKRWVLRKIDFDPSRQALADDFRLAITSAEQGGQARLVDLVVFSLAIAILGSLAENVPVDVFGLMVALKEGDQAFRLASFLPDPVKKIETYVRISDEFMNQEMPVMAAQVLADAEQEILVMQDSEVRDRALLPLVAGFGRLLKLDKVNRYIQQIQNQVFREQVLGQVAVHCSQQNWIEAALDFATRLSIPPLLVTVYARLLAVFQTRLIGQEYIGFLHEKIALAVNALRNNTYPIEYLSIAMGALYLAGENQMAGEIADNYLDLHWIARGLRSLTANGAPALAARLLDKVLQDKTQEELVGAESTDLAKVYAAGGDFGRAEQIVTSHPNRNGEDGAYATIIWDIAAAGQYERAYKLVEKIKDPYIRQWALSGFGLACVQNKDYDLGRTILRDILNQSDLSNISTDQEHFLDRLQLFSSLLRSSQTQNDFKPVTDMSVEVSRAFNVFLKAEEFELAKAVLEFLPDIKSRGDSQVKLISRLANFMVPSDLEEWVDQVHPDFQNAARLIIARQYAQNGQPNEAVKIIPTISKRKLHDEVWREAAISLAGRGEFESADEHLSNIHFKRVLAQARHQVAVVCAKQGLLEKAKFYAEQLDDDNLRLMTYASIAAHFLIPGQEDEAFSLWEACRETRFNQQATVAIALKLIESDRHTEAVGLVFNLPENDWENTLTGIVRILMREKRDNDLRKVETLIQHIPQGFLVQAKIYAYIAENNLTAIQEISPKLPNGHVRHIFNRRVIENLVENEQVESALRLLRDEVEPTGHKDLLLSIATSMAFKGDFLGALNLVERIQSEPNRARVWEEVAINAFYTFQHVPQQALQLLYNGFRLARVKGVRDIYNCLNAFAPLFALLITPEEALALWKRTDTIRDLILQ